MEACFPKLLRLLFPIPSSKSGNLRSFTGIYRRNRCFFVSNELRLRACTTDYSRNLASYILSVLDSFTDLFSLRLAHTLLLVHGFASNLPLQTKLVTSYAVCGNTECAHQVFERITDPDIYSCNAMLKSYIMNDRYLEAIRLGYCLRESLLEQDNVTFCLILKACIKLQDFNEGKKFHCHISKVGSPDDFLLNVLIDMYMKCGDINSACNLFDAITEKNVVSWTTIISGLVHHGRVEDGLLWFNQMRLTNVEPTEYTIGSILSACSSLDALIQGRWIHGYILKQGMSMYTFIGSVLLDMYVKCGKVTDAFAVFDSLDYVDLVTWTAMIVGYTQNGYPLDALKLFSDPHWAYITPNSTTIATALSASAQLCDLNSGQSIHMLAIKLGVSDSNVVLNAIVDMYAKCCLVKEAEYVFQRMIRKDLVTWNAMMAGYSQNGFGSEALLLFNQMRCNFYSTDAVTIVNALSASAFLGSLCIGSSFHALAIRLGFLSSIYVCTALLNFYNKCGHLFSARNVFDEMNDRNVVTWGAMMGGYGMQGDLTSLLDLLQNMLREDLKPNDATFTSILSSCSHTGMVEEGKELFERMCRKFDIVPTMKHYSCMVDMLARAGKLEEAIKFIERMPVNAESKLWGVLLHGCRLHSRLDLGEKVMRKLVEMHPDRPAYYVLLSNLYAADQRWDEAVKVREVMKAKRMIKLPGSSFLCLDGR